MEETSSSSFGGVRKLEETDTDPLLPMRMDDEDIAVKASSFSTEIVKGEADVSNGGDSNDLEAGSAPCCRICLECDGEDGNLFIFYF